MTRREVAVDGRLVGDLGIDEEQAHHPHPVLHPVVRMVEERAALVERELVRLHAARRDRGLRQPRHAVHRDRDLEPMPVDARRLGQVVVHDDANAVAFDRLDRRTGHAAVKAPDVDVEVGQELAPGVPAVEVELLRAALHGPGELLGEVGRRDGHRWLAGLAVAGDELPAVGGAPTGPPAPGCSRGYSSSWPCIAWPWWASCWVPWAPPGATRLAVTSEPPWRKCRLVVSPSIRRSSDNSASSSSRWAMINSRGVQ